MMRLVDGDHGFHASIAGVADATSVPDTLLAWVGLGVGEEAQYLAQVVTGSEAAAAQLPTE